MDVLLGVVKFIDYAATFRNWNNFDSYFFYNLNLMLCDFNKKQKTNISNNLCEFPQLVHGKTIHEV